jgi:putative holliday junction resolvase
MANKLTLSGYILGLDVGTKRIGVAISSVIARLPRPLAPIQGGEGAHASIARLVSEEGITAVAVGLPRNLKGEETAQSRSIRLFAKDLAHQISVPLYFVDESMSSVRADDLLKNNQFKNASQDSLAACFILQEFFDTIETAQES